MSNESIYNYGSFGWRQERAEKPAPYDPARAKQLLAEAGYPNGFETTAHFAEFAGLPNQKEAMDIIASNWKAIGVNGKVVEHDPFKYYAEQDAGKLPLQPHWLSPGTRPVRACAAGLAPSMALARACGASGRAAGRHAGGDAVRGKGRLNFLYV